MLCLLSSPKSQRIERLPVHQYPVADFQEFSHTRDYRSFLRLPTCYQTLKEELDHIAGIIWAATHSV